MKDNLDELIPLIDDDGTTLRAMTRREAHCGSRLLHPVVHLHVFRPDGALYLQKRPDWKDIQPGKWDTAVGGHVDFGETAEQALRRETREEIGLTDFEPAFVAKYIFDSRAERELVYVFKTVTDAEPTPSAETDGGRYFSRNEILERLGKDFFTPNFEQEWSKLFGQANSSDYS